MFKNVNGVRVCYQGPGVAWFKIGEQGYRVIRKGAHRRNGWVLKRPGSDDLLCEGKTIGDCVDHAKTLEVV